MYISQPVLQAAYQAEGLALDYYKGILALRSFAARLAWGKILSYTHERVRPFMSSLPTTAVTELIAWIGSRV